MTPGRRYRITIKRPKGEVAYEGEYMGERNSPTSGRPAFYLRTDGYHCVYIDPALNPAIEEIPE